MEDFIDHILALSNSPSDGSVSFDSSDHVRFLDNQPVSGHNYGCHRRITIEKNIRGHEGYTVTMYNSDGVHPLWQDNIQMAPKRMKIIGSHDDIVDFRGFGVDDFGTPFSDYGISVKIKNKEIEVVQLNMYDRNTSIVYLK